MTPTARRRFPYMFWAHHEGLASPWCLSQSGMPSPDPALFAGDAELALRGPDLIHPCAEAQPAFEARLAELFGVAPERVLATVGASSAMWIAAQRWFGPGNRVVTEIPSYEPFRELPGLFGAERRIVTRRVEDDWRLDLERVRDELRGSSPGHVFVSTPNNPTGATIPEQELVELARLADESGGVLVSNEVYMEFASPADRVHAFALAPNAVSVGSLTKAYGLGALRLGWLVLGEGLVERRDELLDSVYLGYVDPPTASLRLGLAALDRLPQLIGPYLALRQESRPHLVRFLAETPGVEGRAPELGLVAFPRLTGIEDTARFAAELAAEHEVDAVPGEYFGVPGHLRIGFGAPAATIEEGLRRLAAGLESYRPETVR